MEAASAAMKLGPYVLGERLGLGGMAEVYVGHRAGPHGFAKRFAIKRILPELAKDPRFLAMFVDEARICAALQHPNIVQVVDFGESEGELFMAMEFVDGVSVAKLLRNVAGKRERFPISIVLLVVRDVLRGLAFAHEATNEHGQPLGLVHRDVSPGNVLISRAGEVKLADFGIVRSALVDRRTNPGELKGKLGYMSPEQVIGAEVDPRSDLFAVGILLCEMLITCPLFSGKNELEVLTRIHDADLTTFERHGSHVPEPLAEIIRHALAREPRQRFQSAREFGAAIEAYAEQNRISLDSAELAGWLSGLGILPSRSGMHSLNAEPPKAAEPIVTPEPSPASEITRDAAPRREVRRPTPPGLPVDDGRGAGRVDLLEYVCTGRVRRRTKLVGRDGIGRPASEVAGTAELLSRPAFQFGEPEFTQAEWTREIRARELPARIYSLLQAEATGLLVARAGGREKRIFVTQGTLRFVATTEREELLGHRLLRRGVLKETELRPALEVRARGGGHLGEVLIATGAIGPTTLLRELIEQLEERFLELFHWREGTLAFFPGLSSGEQELGVPSSISLVTRGVRAHYPGEELALLLGHTARTPIVAGPHADTDLTRLGMSHAERLILERAVAAGTLEQLTSVAAAERLGTLEETLRAVFVGLSTGIFEIHGSGVASDTAKSIRSTG